MTFEEEQKQRFLDTGARLGVPEGVLTSTEQWVQNPYHNTYHMQSVALLAAEGAENYKLDVNLVRSLFIAGAYHDADHTLGAEPDNINVARAVEVFQTQNPNLPDEERTLITSLILSTEFPGDEHKEHNLLSRILRDSDMLVWCAPKDARSWMTEGLQEESGHTVTDDTTRLFLRSVPFHTSWGLMKVMNSELFTGSSG